MEREAENDQNASASLRSSSIVSALANQPSAPPDVIEGRNSSDQKQYKSSIYFSLIVSCYLVVELTINLPEINKLKLNELFGVYDFLWMNFGSYLIELLFYTRAR